MPIAVGLVVYDRMEVDPRVVPGGIPVAGLGALRLVLGVDRWMAAGGCLAVGVVAHVLFIWLPIQPLGRQLGADVLGVRRVNAPLACLRAVEVREHLAVGLVLGVGRLAGDDRDVVVVALVARAVVVLKQRALAGEGARQVRIRCRIAER